jgi:hypothetical protein
MHRLNYFVPFLIVGSKSWINLIGLTIQRSQLFSENTVWPWSPKASTQSRQLEWLLPEMWPTTRNMYGLLFYYVLYSEATFIGNNPLCSVIYFEYKINNRIVHHIINYYEIIHWSEDLLHGDLYFQNLENGCCSCLQKWDIEILSYIPIFLIFLGGGGVELHIHTFPTFMRMWYK